MMLPTVLLLFVARVATQELEPFNENSISLDGLFDESNFDSINSGSTQSMEESTVASPIHTVSPIESIDAVDIQAQQERPTARSDLIVNEVEFPPALEDETSIEEETRVEGERKKVEGGKKERGESDGQNGISVFRPNVLKTGEKQKNSGRTGWGRKRKRLVKKGVKQVRAKWNVSHNHFTISPQLARTRQRQIVKRIKHIKSDKPLDPSIIPYSKPRASVLRPAPLSRLTRAHFIGSSENTGRIPANGGISRLRRKEKEERGGLKMQSHSTPSILSHVARARTDERSERREWERKNRDQRIEKIKGQFKELDERTKQIQVKSANRRFEVALDRNRPLNSSPLLSSSTFSHFSPRPLLLSPPRTTLLSSRIHRHSRLNANSAPVLLHRLHDGDWLQMLHGWKGRSQEGRGFNGRSLQEIGRRLL